MLEDGLELNSEILPALCQGGTADYQTIYQGQKRLPTIGDPKPFDVVVTLDSYSLPMGWQVKEFRYGFADGPVEPEVYLECERIADWAHSEWKSGSKVLIRCQAGLNRSGLITSLVLLREGMDLIQILDLIRSKRGEFALSNKYFVEYLKGRFDKK